MSQDLSRKLEANPPHQNDAWPMWICGLFLAASSACNRPVSQTKSEPGSRPLPESVADGEIPPEVATKSVSPHLPDVAIPDEQISDILRALPLEPAPNPQHEILATLEVSSNKALEKRCFGSAPGEVLLANCNLETDPEIRGFLTAIEHGRSKIDLILGEAPELREQVSLDVNVMAHGFSDGHLYRSIGPEARAMFALHRELSEVYQHRLPSGTSPEHFLAHTRALVMLEGMGPEFKKTISALNKWDGPKRFKLNTEGSVLPERGPEFRGATLSASMRILVADPTREAIMVAHLQEGGWATIVSPTTQTTEKGRTR